MVVAGKTVTVQIGKEMQKIVLADCIRKANVCVKAQCLVL